jgi:tetratricopeptide (TPR) repeat protein
VEQFVDLFSIGNTFDLFSATIQQPDQLESLANGALSKGIDLYMKKDYLGAIKEFRRSIGLAPQSSYSVDAANYMADAHLALDDTEGAIEAYETALSLNPYRDDIYIKLGNLYFAKERYEEAAEAYEKAVKIWSSADNYYALGQAYMRAGRHSDAETVFNQVLRMEPHKPNGNFGLGLNYSRQGRYEDAILQFKETIRLNSQFYDAYAEMGYAYADLGEIEEAQRLVDVLDHVAPELGGILSSYMYKVDPPKIMFAYAGSDFNYHLPWKTPLSALDAYLGAPDTEKTFKIIFQFDKEMDRDSVENELNWKIGRSTASGPGQAYNFGRPIPDTEITLPPIPKHVYYDADNLTATVYFTIKQNSSADGTIDPAHIEFSFNGKDAFGYKMDPKHDQFSAFSGIA